LDQPGTAHLAPDQWGDGCGSVRSSLDQGGGTLFQSNAAVVRSSDRHHLQPAEPTGPSGDPDSWKHGG